MTPKELTATLTEFIKHQHNVLITSSPGCGKTAIVNQIAQALDADLIPMFPAISDPTDAKGMPWVIDGIPQFVPFDKLKRLITANKLTICFLDDFGQAASSVQASFMQLIYARSVDGTPISPYVVFIAATNDKKHKAGVLGLIEPVKSRFVTILNLTSSINDWTEWATVSDIHPQVINFINAVPEALDDFKPTTDLTNSPSPRTWENVSKIAYLNLSPSVEYECFSGAVGSGRAMEFQSFREKESDLPLIKDLLNPSSQIYMPKENHLIYFLINQLVYKANPKNIERIIEISTHMDQEFATLLLNKCKSFNKLLITNVNLITKLNQLGSINQISGDKVEGGTINAVTVNTLTSTTVNATT